MYMPFEVLESREVGERVSGWVVGSSLPLHRY